MQKTEVRKPRIDARQASEIVQSICPPAVDALNRLAAETLTTRGGRAGSGLGSLIEALWGFMVNSQIRLLNPVPPIELAWFPDHAYNDFACVLADEEWEPRSKVGELFRLEAKSMFASADESKAHFDAISSEIQEDDLLVVLVWDWRKVPVAGKKTTNLVAPAILSSFIGPAKRIAEFRDALHLARGGSFVTPPCPDGCRGACNHIGEPLNADGKRERRTGPETRKPNSASYAANFGGMVRMMKTNSSSARKLFRRFRRESELVHYFISFMHTAFPDEEKSQYLLTEWRDCARKLKMPAIATLDAKDLIEKVRQHPGYQDILRTLE